MKPDIGISEKNLKGITAMLSSVLADEVVLYTKTRKFHWNVSGPSFMELHLLFESQYTELEKTIDEVAERISKLGAPAPGTMQEFAELTSLKETPGKNPSQPQMITELLGDHESVIIQLRKNIKKCDEEFEDAGTTDFLTKVMEDHETLAWKLRRYIR